MRATLDVLANIQPPTDPLSVAQRQIRDVLVRLEAATGRTVQSIGIEVVTERWPADEPQVYRQVAVQFEPVKRWAGLSAASPAAPESLEGSPAAEAGRSTHPADPGHGSAA